MYAFTHNILFFCVDVVCVCVWILVLRCMKSQLRHKLK